MITTAAARVQAGKSVSERERERERKEQSRKPRNQHRKNIYNNEPRRTNVEFVVEAFN